MLKKFVYWHWKDDSQGQFSEGEDISKFANGTPMFKESEVIKRYVIWAETWKEAMSIHYLRSGFGPYKPMGRPRQWAAGSAFVGMITISPYNSAIRVLVSKTRSLGSNPSRVAT